MTFYKMTTAETATRLETCPTPIDRLYRRENIPFYFFSTGKRNKPTLGLVTATRGS